MIERGKALLVSLVFFVLAVSTALVMAQEPTVPPKPDVTQTLATLIAAAGGVIIPWVVWLVAGKLIPKIPRSILPLAPVILGFAVEALVKLSTGMDSALGGAGIALLASILRAVINTVSQHGWMAGGGGAVVAPR